MELVEQVTEGLKGLVGSPWLWVLVVATSGLDALLPFMPSETTVLTVAVLLGPDPAKLVLLAVLAAAGAFAGDCLGYAIGRSAGPHVIARLQRGPSGRRRYEWARTKVGEHATLLIVAGRYLPGGRVASGLATGSLHYPLRRFIPLDAAGAALWAIYAVLIGFAGGAGFADEPAKGLLLSFGLGLALVGAIEFGRRLRLQRISAGLSRSRRQGADGHGER
ncbi:MAG: DedA-like rane protein [Amycolatopsis sp.]|uniref:DedA family protein n=1 Tax=Amycolatopsis sp. TaxID=37632 RepID=UPI0026123B5D|nr:VTT domain-containing protein [Amycolatopsis sp.]MCU1684835.1 DedA-like rane protein [Amycolatopsis sp.]